MWSWLLIVIAVARSLHGWHIPPSEVLIALWPAEARESAPLLEVQEWIDIDSADADNELACTDYVEAIMEHLYVSEVRSASCMHPSPVPGLPGGRVLGSNHTSWVPACRSGGGPRTPT